MENKGKKHQCPHGNKFLFRYTRTNITSYWYSSGFGNCMTVSEFVKWGKAGDAETQIALFTFGSKSWRASNTCTPSSLIPGRRLNEMHVAVYPDGVRRTAIDEIFFWRELVFRTNGPISVPLQIILHNISSKVQQRLVLIDTSIQNAGILHRHINSQCENWPPPLFTRFPIRYAL